MFRESVILVTLVAGIAARFVRSYPPRQEALTRCLAFAGFQLQVVHLMGELLFWRQSMHDQRDRGGWVRRVVVDRMATP
jgi:hypothetical protein